MSDFLEDMIDFTVEHRTSSTIAVVVLIAFLAMIFFVIPEAVRKSEMRDAADSAAVKRHLDWLRSMPDSEKTKWPIQSVCRPSLKNCECENWDHNVVVFMQILPNGDVACHQTR